MNQVTVIGFLGSDPELKYLPNGTAVCEFSMADNRKYTDSAGATIESVQWFRIHAFGNTGENASQYLAKGRQVAVFGRLEASAYESKDGKQIHPSLDVYANTVQFLGSGDTEREDTAEGGDDAPDARPKPRRSAKK